ncbi:serine/threonine protein kinase [Fischerella sp. PCC 9605]|uniref:serine/threonine protein kinase n=1 Tax=Fischerella sp. PCC 9605 TaxID=1173024 RepID=UPI00047BC1AA|nr:serine/threonine protein kinase [Fischerella sp. PCC 9605]
MATLLNDRYQVIQVLGVGGFSETFLAEDTYLPSRRRCVIKQLKPITNDPKIYQKIQRRFEREATTLEYLGEGSNQIPKLYAYFSENGQFYLVQEWIEGQTLANIIKTQGSLCETAVTEILLSLLSVLDYVHSKGIIHRDIKPDNIILRSSNHKPVLIDFGAVKETIRSAVVNSPVSTTQSLVMGTPGYMPSEQFTGRPVYATDIYSLGLTAIYLLTGKHPRQLQTDPRTGEIIWQHYAPGVSPQLAMILNRAIKPQAGDRYTTASQMLHALQSATLSRQSPPYAPITSKQPLQGTDSPTQTPTTQPTLPPNPAPSTASLQTQPLSSQQNALATLVHSIPRNWQKPTWIFGSLIVAGLIGTVAIVSITRKPEFAHSPPSTIPTPLSESKTTNPTESPESPTSTSEEANTPAASPPKQQRSTLAPTPLKPQDTPVASAQPEQDNQTPTVFKPKNNEPRNQLPNTTNINQVPGFSPGILRSTVEATLGKPTHDSRGIWRNTRAVSYILVPNRIQLGYLFDRDSGKIRQTEIAFSQSVDLQVILKTLEGMLGGKLTEEIQQALMQVLQRRLDNFRFSVGFLKGQIVRQECGLIYISIWDSDLHDFVNPADAKKC